MFVRMKKPKRRLNEHSTWKRGEEVETKKTKQAILFSLTQHGSLCFLPTLADVVVFPAVMTDVTTKVLQ